MQGRNKENSTLVLRRRPRAAGAGPAPLVLLRGSTSLRLPISNTNGRALSCSAASRTALRRFASLLRQPGGLPTRFRKPLRVLLHGSASPGGLATQLGEPARFAYGFALVSPRALRSRLRRLLAALGALRSPRVFFLSFPRKRESRRSGLHSFVIHTMRQTHGRFRLQCLQ